MKKISKSLKNNEKGAAMVIMVLCFTVFLTLAALVVDIGIAHASGAELQKAADAAVFAGGRFLPVGIDDVNKQKKIENEILTYFKKNGMTEQKKMKIIFTDEINGRYYGVEAAVTEQMKTTFAKVIGIDKISVGKEAGVVVRPSISAQDVVPVCVVQSEIDALIESGNTKGIILKYGGGDGSNGAFGAINLSGVNGGGARQFEEWVSTGYTSEISIGEKMYPVEPGNMAGPTNRAFGTRYAGCSHFTQDGGCTADHFEPTCSRVIKIPVVTYVTSKKVAINGFAVFVLEDCASQNGEIRGSYVDSVVGGKAEFEGQLDQGTEYGAYSMTLAK